VRTHARPASNPTHPPHNAHARPRLIALPALRRCCCGAPLRNRRGRALLLFGPPHLLRPVPRPAGPTPARGGAGPVPPRRLRDGAGHDVAPAGRPRRECVFCDGKNAACGFFCGVFVLAPRLTPQPSTPSPPAPVDALSTAVRTRRACVGGLEGGCKLRFFASPPTPILRSLQRPRLSHVRRPPKKQKTTATRPTFTGLHHVGLLVSNLEASLDFYCGVLGEFLVFLSVGVEGKERERSRTATPSPTTPPSLSLHPHHLSHPQASPSTLTARTPSCPTAAPGSWSART
jgi:hypothetical protein